MPPTPTNVWQATSGIRASSGGRIVKRLSEAIASLKPQYIKMPDAPETDVIKRKFHDVALISLISKSSISVI